jgi:SAM-dependent methyltransferase
MRVLVGPTETSAFDNPDHLPLYPWLPTDRYESVVDFACGCGRTARQLALQDPRPEHYVGFDVHLGMVQWCEQHLAPVVPGFEFRHHDVYQLSMNPDPAKPEVLPFPAPDDSATLVIGHSIFTHLVEGHAQYYLDEVARVLRVGGSFVSTWFLFDKREYPMLQEHMNALYVSDRDPAWAVIIDRAWLLRRTRDLGLVLVHAQPPGIRGFQWTLTFEPAGPGVHEIELPPDQGPIGAWEAPRLDGIADASRVGRDDA